MIKVEADEYSWCGSHGFYSPFLQGLDHFFEGVSDLTLGYSSSAPGPFSSLLHCLEMLASFGFAQKMFFSPIFCARLLKSQSLLDSATGGL